MTTKSFAEAMNYMDDDLISEAITYKRAKKTSGWLKWGVMAACLCLVVGIAVPFLHNDTPDQGNHGGLQSVENPVYDVVEYAVPADYTAGDLYIATTAGLDGYDAHMVDRYGEEYLGKGVRVFSFSEGTKPTDLNIWYFAYEGNNISRIYFVTELDGKYLTSWREAGELGKAIEALSGETSADTPMYLAQDDEMVFAIIGDTAYYLPDFTVFKPEVTAMPEIETDGLETVVIEATE